MATTDAGGWIRNLTKEGVEPNPGPSMSVIFDEIATRFPDVKDLVRGDLAKIENEIKTTVTVGAYGYTDEHVKFFFLGRSLEELAKIVGDDEKAATLDKEVRESLKLPTRAAQQPDPPGAQALYLDFSDARPLLDSILKTQIAGCPLKSDFTVPQRLSFEDPFPCTARTESFTMTYEYMTKRMNQRCLYEAAINWQYNPLIAMHATPGGGKSFFLDQLALLDAGDLEYCASSEMREYLQNSLPLAITYNNNTPYKIAYDEFAETGLALRCLYSFFYVQNADFTALWSRVPPGTKPTLTLVLKCILLQAGKLGKSGVLLCVDELIKAGAGVEKEIDLVLSAIGACLDNFSSSQFNAIVSTLNQLPVLKMSTTSGRNICWVPLPHPTLDEAVSLFQEDDRVNQVLLQCVADCAGHFRSLAKLAIKWKVLHTSRPSYGVLFDEVARELNYPINKLTLPLIKAALSGEIRDLDREIDSDTRTFRECIEEGVYINNLPDNATEAVPKLSPLYLLLWARSKLLLDEHTRGTPHQHTKEIAAIIYRLFRLEPNFGWKQFEQFHATWELLCRSLFSGEQGWDLKYCYSPSSTSTVGDRLHLPVRKKRHIIPLDHQFKKAAPELQADVLFDSVFELGEHNPGFDILMFEPATAHTNNTAICIECRFSAPTSKSKLRLADVLHKHKCTMRLFKPYIGGNSESAVGKLNLKKEDIILVICAFRELSNELKTTMDVDGNDGGSEGGDTVDVDDSDGSTDSGDEGSADSGDEGSADSGDEGIIDSCDDLPENVIVFGKKDLMAMYSPSLSYRPLMCSRKK